MKLWQNGLRMLIAGGSVFGFVGGWILFAHSGKPVALDAPAPVPQRVAPSAPLRPSDLLQQQPSTPLQPLQPLTPLQQAPRFRLRSGGS